MKPTRAVWITGASSGIGQEFARRYARMGCRLVLIARRRQRLEELAAELSASCGAQCRVLPADLESEADLQMLAGEIKREERIDVFINNAGFGTCGSFVSTDPERENALIRVNVLAMHTLCKLVLRKMHDTATRGTILNVASSAGLLPGGPYMAAYYASKAYVVSLTRAIAEEERQSGGAVHICALCPGPVNTEFNDNAGVVFALKGITPAFCVEEAMRGIARRKVIIVPSAMMRAAMAAQHLVPTPILMPIVAHQQRSKLEG